MCRRERSWGVGGLLKDGARETPNFGGPLKGFSSLPTKATSFATDAYIVKRQVPLMGWRTLQVLREQRAHVQRHFKKLDQKRLRDELEVTRESELSW